MNLISRIPISNIAICCLILIASIPSSWSYPEGKEYLPPKTGGSAVSYGDDGLISEPANYDFSYEVKDPTILLEFGHNEKRKGDLATGTYKVLLPDGRTQIVEYEAGIDGYKPQVRYEGVASIGTGGGRGRGGGDGGYNYNAATNQKLVRQPAPKTLISTPKTVIVNGSNNN